MFEQVILRRRSCTGRGSRGDIVQDLVIAELGQLGTIDKVLRVALCDRDLQAVDASLIDQITLMLKLLSALLAVE
jgi:hypothetical protein